MVWAHQKDVSREMDTKKMEVYPTISEEKGRPPSNWDIDLQKAQQKRNLKEYD